MLREQRIQKERIRLIVGAVLTVIAPPIGILLIIWDLVDSQKKKRAEKTRTAHPMEKNARSSGRQELGNKTHGHTPIEYSYDSCASSRRLEQLEILYRAGLYTKEQYREAKAKLLQKS